MDGQEAAGEVPFHGEPAGLHARSRTAIHGLAPRFEAGYNPHSKSLWQEATDRHSGKGIPDSRYFVEGATALGGE